MSQFTLFVTGAGTVKQKSVIHTLLEGQEQFPVPRYPEMRGLTNLSMRLEAQEETVEVPERRRCSLQSGLEVCQGHLLGPSGKEITALLSTYCLGLKFISDKVWCLMMYGGVSLQSLIFCFEVEWNIRAGFLFALWFLFVCLFYSFLRT